MQELAKLDLVNLSMRGEAILATKWIKDRLEGLKLQNLALATTTGPALRSFPKIMTKDVQYALNKCELLGSGKQLIFDGKPWAIERDFLTRVCQFSTSFFAENGVLVLHDSPGHPRRQFLTSLLPAVNPLFECWKTRSRPIGVRVCLVAKFNFFSTAFDPRAWTMVFSGKKVWDVSSS